MRASGCWSRRKASVRRTSLRQRSTSSASIPDRWRGPRRRCPPSRPRTPSIRTPASSPGSIAASVEWFKERLPAIGYQGGLEENFLLPTAVGAVKPSALVPETMAAGDLRAGGHCVFVGLGLKDFYPAYLAENLAQARLDGHAVSPRAIEVSLPLAGRPDRSSAGFARLLEEPSVRDALVRELIREARAGRTGRLSRSARPRTGGRGLA